MLPLQPAPTSTVATRLAVRGQLEARPESHGERVTLSADAREAARAASPPVRGQIRWYRAVRFGLDRATIAQANTGSSGAATSAPRHAAVEAYRRTMAAAA
jgi:hypothetical protein